MGSIFSSGETCPVCGRKAVSYEFFYKSGEEFDICLCCGYKKDIFLKRDENRQLVRHLAQTVDLRESLVYIGTADQISDSGNVTRLGSPVRVTSDTTQETLDKVLYDNRYAEVFLQLPEEYQRLAAAPFAQFKVEKGQLSVLEPEWLIEEKGGYGVLRLEDEQGKSRISYSLLEGDTIESILASMEEEEKPRVRAIVTFSPRGENPSFYNTTSEEWFAQFEF